MVFVSGLVAYLYNANKTSGDDPDKEKRADATPGPGPGRHGPPPLLAAGVTTPARTPGVRLGPDPLPPAGGGAVPARATIPATTPANPAGSAAALADGRAKIDAGDLLTGRKILNDALVAGQFTPPDVAAAKALISKANQTLIFSPQRLPNDPYATAYTVPPGGALVRIAYSHLTTGDFLCRINGITDARRLRAGQQIKIVDGPFHAVVNKAAFTLDLYLGAPGGPGSMYVTTYPVGLGKENSTPEGTWVVEPKRKLKDPVYYPPPEHGGKPIPAGDPANPLGKFWISLKGTDGQALGKTSYGIHGNIDPNSIGKMESMGCIRLRNEDIPLVYEMLFEGKSLVVVKN